MIDESMSPPGTDPPVSEMTNRALLREARSLGGVGLTRLDRTDMEQKVLDLRKIRDELAEEERRQGSIEVIGWLRPKSPGLPWTPVIKIQREGGPRADEPR